MRFNHKTKLFNQSQYSSEISDTSTSAVNTRRVFHRKSPSIRFFESIGMDYGVKSYYEKK